MRQLTGLSRRHLQRIESDLLSIATALDTRVSVLVD
ncbi:hypothetical protein HDA41_003583 [Streptomyces caelestis]|uniref:Uncharacterized protein n=1 Tax=Streptomyces caelestis TaxID=36816 RepID=A0A7W9H4L7_9ACTN|nr:hypothetical protein [Streptomyces caelestis]